MNYTLIVDGVKDLVHGIKTNTWPDIFVNELLGLSGEKADKLPDYMMYFMIIYGVAAVISIILHFVKKQKCFSDFGRKMMDFICTVLMVMCCWLIPQFIAQGRLLADQVEGEFSFTKEGISWLSSYLQAWFDPIWLAALFAAIAIMPLLTVRRYIKEYKLLGLAWAIYDVGFGILCICAAGMAMASGSIIWYLVIPTALIAIKFGQTGGVDLE